MEAGEECSSSNAQLISTPEVVFIARHGERHQFPPHKVNYRANMAALKDAAVSAIYAVNVVGGINMEMCPGDLVIPDQIIDYTWGSENTYSDGSVLECISVQHVDFTNPYDESLRKNLLHQAIALGFQVHLGGVYGATQGPRLESAAEISRMGQDGCDIVGMTGMPEAALARELGLPYASLALVVNLAAGLSDEEITLPQIQEIMDKKMTDVRRLLMAVARSHSL
jgi:5'-methylthioinosine phosphorylase